MLDAYIIEKIRREQDRHDHERAPLDAPRPRRDRRPTSWQDDDRDDHESNRGVVILEF